jgi:hypothetical protein
MAHPMRDGRSKEEIDGLQAVKTKYFQYKY